VQIATFNANSVRSRMDIILRWLAQEQPDALALQETKVQDSDFPVEPFEQAGYHVVFRGQKSYNGVAILSREPAAEVSFGLDDDGPADEARLATARIGPVILVNTYVPQGREVEHEMFAYKCQWFRRLRGLFERRFAPDDPVVWLGDINVAAEPIDVSDPERREQHVCFHRAAREAFADCRAWGFVDVFRQRHPEPGNYTFFDYRTRDAVQSGKGWRIDYILATPRVAETCTDCWIDLAPRRESKASDHTFLAAAFEL
jgi:exodeoxyribonuclease-3